jgi:hypothetical protein
MVFSIRLRMSYMSIQSIQSETFIILALMKLDKSSFFWAFVEGEWCLHQIDVHWQVTPNQRILYRAFDVEEDECVGLEGELKKQPQTMMARLGKRKGEETVSPVKKVPKVGDTLRPLDMATRLDTDSPQSVHAAVRSMSSSPPLPTTLDEIISMAEDKMVTTTSSTAVPTRSTAPTRSMTTINTKRTSTTSSTLPAATRQWPHDFSLQEVVNGLEQLRKLQKDGYRQDEAFAKIFWSEMCVGDSPT